MVRLSKSISEQLSKPLQDRHRAAALAYDICALAHLANEGSGVRELQAAFMQALKEANLSDVLSNHIDYAVSLATCKRNLEYEEMHKLFSLCDEIEALQSIGIIASEDSIAALRGALTDRFQMERSKARLVAEDRLEGWKREWWWYSVNLS
jgi:hypothetical protein